MTLAASPGQLVIEPDQAFIISNNGQVPIRLGWDHRVYVIEPGDHKIVPFDVVRLHFGDPRAVKGMEQRYEDRDNPSARVAKREDEIQRLVILYGLYAGNEPQLPEHEKIKYIQIMTMDRQEIFCPAMDPDGLMGSYAHREANDTVQDTHTMLLRMERRLAQQQALIDELRGQSMDDQPDDDVGTDHPRFPE